MSHLTDVLHEIARGTGLTWLHEKIDHIHDEPTVTEETGSDDSNA